MQAEHGLSLDAQRAVINAYCAANDLRLIRTFEDVESGGSQIELDWQMRWSPKWMCL